MISDCRCVFIGVKSPGSGINGRMLRMGENGIKAEISNFCSARPGAGEICRLPRGNVGRGSWRAGRPPDLPGWKKAIPWRESPASAVRSRGGGGYSNFRENLMLEGAGGPVALQTSSDWRRQYRGGNFRLLWCAVGSGGDMQAAAASFPVVGAGGPVALQTSSDGRTRYRSGNFRLLWCAVGSGRDMQAAAASLPVVGAGGPVALQTSSPVRRQKLVASFSACGPSGLTLPGCARQLLSRRSGSARLRSTASQLLLAALRNAKQFSHMRSRR